MMMEQAFFSSWTSIARILLVGVAAYAGLVVLLRVSGKRTLTKMNAFDLVVTVALGSTLATVLLTKSVALTDGLTAFALLIFLQFVLTWLSIRSRAVSRLVKSEPALLVYQGQFLPAALKEERITEDEVLASLRAHGLASIADAGAVVLETNGELSVLRHAGVGPDSVLRGVAGA
nr:YetF domain-containing protein [Hymenobacter sp. DG25B]